MEGLLNNKIGIPEGERQRRSVPTASYLSLRERNLSFLLGNNNETQNHSSVHMNTTSVNNLPTRDEVDGTQMPLQDT